VCVKIVAVGSDAAADDCALFLNPNAFFGLLKFTFTCFMFFEF